MAFTVQDDNGSIAGANAYHDVPFYKVYQKDRGVTVASGSSDIQSAIIQATDYLDFRYRFIGERLTTGQTTEWPRSNVIDEAREIRDSEIPLKIKEACSILALKVLNGTDLFPDEDFDTAGVVTEKREKVDVLEEQTKYASRGSGSSFGRTPSFPKIDRMLREFITENQGRIFRSS